MESSLKLFLAFSISMLAICPVISSEVQATWSKKETHLHLYFHEINTGPLSTTAVVVPLNSSAFGFGGMVVIDDDLREGPEPCSKLVGRAQGLLTAVSQHDQTSFLFSVNFVFTAGMYKGSTLAVFGRAVPPSDTREWSIIGGTGRFKLARGYVHGRKLTPLAPTSLLLELDIYVIKEEYVLNTPRLVFA